MSESAKSASSKPCVCTDDSSSEESLPLPECECPRDDLGIVIHEPTCLMFKSEKITYPHDPICECQSPPFKDGLCLCCNCAVNQCRCNKAGKEAFDEWRKQREIGAMPAVLEASHPLMQKFQETLKQFLIKENSIAEEEILNLREELRLSTLAYDKDLEDIYLRDHDTNAQRVLIEEYEATLAQRTMEREAAEKRARESNEKYKNARAMLEETIMNERDATLEMEALNALCNQLESWSNETESDLTVSQRMSHKMRAEKKALADEKRQLDMFLFGLNNEVWKLESRMELFKKQMEIKNGEMEKVNNKVTAFAAELEELDLDKRRLISLWNSVIVNIKQRDAAYDSVRDDYKTLQDSYYTLINSLEITKKILQEEMNKGRGIAMAKEKLLYDIDNATKLNDAEEAKRLNYESQIDQLAESLEMTERDQEMIKTENQTMGNILKSTCKELDRKIEYKLKLDNEILLNLQECLLNDKAVESMANGIRKMREMSRKQEISLMSLENQHAHIMLEIETQKSRENKNVVILEASQALVKEKEKELDSMQADYTLILAKITKKQREMDIISKRHSVLKEIFDSKSPQELRIDNLEKHIKVLRERTEVMQHEWLRQQGHVVKLANQHQMLVTDINLIVKQIQICDSKVMRIQAELETINSEQNQVDRALRALRSRLQVLERTRKEAVERNQYAHRNNMDLTHVYSDNLKGAETEIIQLEEDIDELDREKMNLTQELDRVQREALIWQRKGILAVEARKCMKDARSAAGDIGQMKTEIHRMEVRREQLRRTSEKLADDLALYVTRRDTAMDKTRAAAAAEKSHGQSTSQTVYHHRLRLAKTDVNRVNKEVAEAKSKIEQLEKEQERLDRQITDTTAMNSQLEENIAQLMKKTRINRITKHWLLERVVRTQRYAAALSTAIKRQSVRIKKPRNYVLEENARSRLLNNRLTYVVGVLLKEYPQHQDKLESIANTLNIFSPSATPEQTDSWCVLLKSGELTVTDEEILEAAREELVVLSQDPWKPKDSI